MIRARESKSAPVGVVTRVLRILEALHAAPGGLALRDVARLTGINKSTAYRILAHLESDGYLFKGNAGAYSIGPKLARLASATNHHTALRETSRPILDKLWEATGETINLAIPDGNEVLYLDVIESPHSFRLVSHAGMRRPMHGTALGKAVMAYLSAEERENLLALVKGKDERLARAGRPANLRKELAKVCQQGYAVDDQESTLGARCVGAPIFEEAGSVVGAISISGPTTRIGKKQIPALGAKVAEAAQAISARLKSVVSG
jgi:DNA-binding IclR family transcriptional regulator